MPFELQQGEQVFLPIALHPDEHHPLIITSRRVVQYAALGPFPIAEFEVGKIEHIGRMSKRPLMGLAIVLAILGLILLIVGAGKCCLRPVRRADQGQPRRGGAHGRRPPRRGQERGRRLPFFDKDIQASSLKRKAEKLKKLKEIKPGIPPLTSGLVWGLVSILGAAAAGLIARSLWRKEDFYIFCRSGEQVYTIQVQNSIQENIVLSTLSAAQQRGRHRAEMRPGGAAPPRAVAVGLGLRGAAAPRPRRRAPPPRGAADRRAADDGSMAAPGTDDSENVALARRKGERRLFSFEPYGEAALRRARAEGRFLLLDGAAEWCHWCHVMDETTYLDPEVGRLLRDRFVAIRVDVDERPDLAERYGAWGWPATISSRPDGGGDRQVPRLPPPGSACARSSAASSRRGAAATAAAPAPTDRLGELPAPPRRSAGSRARALADLDAYYDDEQGGWGAPAEGAPRRRTSSSSCGAPPTATRRRCARGRRRSSSSARCSIRCGAASTSTRRTATGSTRTSRS